VAGGGSSEPPRQGWKPLIEGLPGAVIRRFQLLAATRQGCSRCGVGPMGMGWAFSPRFFSIGARKCAQLDQGHSATPVARRRRGLRRPQASGRAIGGAVGSGATATRLVDAAGAPGSQHSPEGPQGAALLQPRAEASSKRRAGGGERWRWMKGPEGGISGGDHLPSRANRRSARHPRPAGQRSSGRAHAGDPVRSVAAGSRERSGSSPWAWHEARASEC